jgi:hypothetical protein
VILAVKSIARATPAISKGRDQTDFGTSGGHTRRAAKRQNSPGITIGPEKIAALQPMELNSYENAITQRGVMKVPTSRFLQPLLGYASLQRTQ